MSEESVNARLEITRLSQMKGCPEKELLRMLLPEYYETQKAFGQYLEEKMNMEKEAMRKARSKGKINSKGGF